MNKQALAAYIKALEIERAAIYDYIETELQKEYFSICMAFPEESSKVYLCKKFTYNYASELSKELSRSTTSTVVKMFLKQFNTLLLRELNNATTVEELTIAIEKAKATSWATYFAVKAKMYNISIEDAIENKLE